MATRGVGCMCLEQVAITPIRSDRIGLSIDHGPRGRGLLCLRPCRPVRSAPDIRSALHVVKQPAYGLLPASSSEGDDIRQPRAMAPNSWRGRSLTAQSSRKRERDRAGRSIARRRSAATPV